MSKKKSTKRRAAKPARDWSAKEKVEAVFEAASVPDEDLGAFLRERGLVEADLETWRAAIVEASAGALDGSSRRKKAKPTAEQKRIRELERELNRKEKALAEVAALLALKKKAQVIWGDEVDDTPRRSDG